MTTFSVACKGKELPEKIKDVMEKQELADRYFKKVITRKEMLKMVFRKYSIK